MIASPAAALPTVVLARIRDVAVAFPARVVLRTIAIEALAVVPGGHPALRGLTAVSGLPVPVVDGSWLLGRMPAESDPPRPAKPLAALLLVSAHGRLAVPIDDYRSRVVHPPRRALPTPVDNAGCAAHLVADLIPGGAALLVDPAALDLRLGFLRSHHQPAATGTPPRASP